jgi:hypothetical protein
VSTPITMIPPTTNINLLNPYNVKQYPYPSSTNPTPETGNNSTTSNNNGSPQLNGNHVPHFPDAKQQQDFKIPPTYVDSPTSTIDFVSLEGKFDWSTPANVTPPMDDTNANSSPHSEQTSTWGYLTRAAVLALNVGAFYFLGTKFIKYLEEKIAGPNLVSENFGQDGNGSQHADIPTIERPPSTTERDALFNMLTTLEKNRKKENWDFNNKNNQ